MKTLRTDLRVQKLFTEWAECEWASTRYSVSECYLEFTVFIHSNVTWLQILHRNQSMKFIWKISLSSSSTKHTYKNFSWSTSADKCI